MSYTFRIWFTGLCHFVLNRDPNALCRLCVAVPHARGEDYRDHIAAIYHVNRVKDGCDRMRIEAGKQILQLNRHRVAFGFTRRDPIAIPGNPDFLNEGLLWMGHIAGGFSDANDEIVSLDPPPAVIAQILLESSYVEYDKELSVQRDWEIPVTLTGGNPVTRRVADPMFVEFSNVEGASLTAFSMKGAGREVHDLSNVREILIANRCEKDEGNLGTIEVRQEGEQQISWVQVDTDFKFNFDMLASSSIAAIERFMAPQEMIFPVPKSPLLTVRVAPHTCIRAEDAPPIEKVLELLEGAGVRGTGTGSGGDCLGSQGLARFVDLDDYILAARPQETGQALEALSASASEPQDLEASGATLPPLPPEPATWKR